MVSSYFSFVVMLLFVSMNGGSFIVGAIPCQDAIARMLPCQGFLIGFGDISVSCCQSAQSLSQIANSSPQDLTSICQCLKQAANVIGINVSRAQQIPQLCHIDFASGLIDPNVDCNNLNAPAPTPAPQISMADQIAPAPADSPQNEGENMKLNKLDQIRDLIIAPSPDSPQI